MKQKYLKIHQKNHCVGIRTSTFANFRTAVSKVRREGMLDQIVKTDVTIISQNKSERMPLQLTQRLESVSVVRGEADAAKGGELATKADGRVAFVARGREVQLAQR